MTEEERQRRIEAFRKSMTGPMGPQGPMGGLGRETVGMPGRPVNFPQQNPGGPSVMDRVGGFLGDISGISQINSYADAAVPSDPNKPYNFINKELPGLGIALGSAFAGPVAKAGVKGIGMPIAEKVAGFVGDDMFMRGIKPLSNMSFGGNIRKSFTPMGPNLTSSRIMNLPQYGAAKTGLMTVAGNTADAAYAFTKTYTSQAVNELARKIASAANAGGAVARWMTGLGD